MAANRIAVSLETIAIGEIWSARAFADVVDTFGILLGVVGPIVFLYAVCTSLLEKRGMRLYGLAVYLACCVWLLPRAGAMGRREVSHEIALPAIVTMMLLGVVLFVKAGVHVVARRRRRRAGMLDL